MSENHLQFKDCAHIYRLFEQDVSLIPRIKGTKDKYPFPYKEYFDGEKKASIDQINEWKSKGYDFAAVCGVSSLVVFDFDSEKSYYSFWDKSLGEKLPSETLCVQTSRGVQVWFFDSQIDLLKSKPSVDFRPVLEMEMFLHHHLAACPGNLHPSGIPYKLLGTSRIMKKDGAVRHAVERLYSLGWVGSIYKESYAMGSGPSNFPEQVNEIDDVERALNMLVPYWISARTFTVRSKFMIALSGYLMRRGIKEESAVKFAVALTARANDSKASRKAADRMRALYKSARSAQKVQGLPSLTRIMKEIEEQNIS